MSNFLSLLKPKADLSKNGFDLSQKHVFSLSSGRLDCPLFVETIPNDNFRIDLASLMRTMTFNTASFLRGKLTFDLFFVPYAQLWHPFNQFVSQRKDLHTTLQKGCQFVPHISLGKLLLLIFHARVEDDDTIIDSLRDVHNFAWIGNIVRILDFLGYGNFEWFVRGLEPHGDDPNAMIDENNVSTYVAPYMDKHVNLFRIAAYQHIWYDYYRNKYYDLGYSTDGTNIDDYVKLFNFDDLDCTTFANAELPVPVAAENVDWNDPQIIRVVNIFKQRYVQYKQDVLQSALPSQQFGAVSSVVIGDGSGSSQTVPVALTGSVVFPSGSTISSTYPDTITGSTNVSRILRNTTNAMVPNVTGFRGDTTGHVIASTSSESNVPVNLVSNHTHRIVLDGTTAAASVGGDLTIPSTGSGSFDVLALRRAEVLQKWRQNALRAGNMTDDSFRAHYGTAPRYAMDENVVKLGSFESVLNVNPVEATADTGGSNGRVGDLAATGVSVTSGNTISFDCSDFGVIVGCVYFRPESEYSSTMLDRANILSEPFDFFTPEFMNVGLDSIRMSDYSIADFHTNFNSNLGFAPQYWWYKTAFDKVHGEFARYYYNRLSRGSVDYDTLLFKGNMLPWVAPRNLHFERVLGQDDPLRELRSLYVSPDVLDDVFAVNYEDTSGLFNKVVDTFIVNVAFDIKALRTMSVIGLPEF